MAWDGAHRGKTHYAVKAAGAHVAVAACGRRLVSKKTDKRDGVNCFACLKKIGVLK